MGVAITDPYYAESGRHHEGLPLVLLHGFCETHRLWDEFRQELGAHFRVLCPDLPGFGLSTSLPKGFSLQDVADRLATWLEQLSIKECVLVGHSLGGYVALSLLQHHPGLVRGIGLFHSTAYADTPGKRRSRTHVIDFVEKHGVEVFATSFVPQLFYHSNRRRLKEAVAAVVAEAAATPQHTLIGYTRAMRERPNLMPALQHFSEPILLIVGEKDTSVPIEVSLNHLEALPRADAYVLEDTGHMGMLEQSEKTLEIVFVFMNKARGFKRDTIL